MKSFLVRFKDSFSKYRKHDERWKYFVLGILVSFISLFAFLSIIQEYFENGGNYAIDKVAINFVKSIETPLLSKIIYKITMLGNSLAVIIITILAALFLIYKNLKNEAGFLTLNILGVWLLNEALKASFKRNRPDIRIIEVRGYSLPSGHAMIFMTLAIMASYLILIHLKAMPIRWFFATLLIILAIAIGLSRVYLRVHYLSDVLAGWSAGAFWSALNIIFHRYSYYKKNAKRF
ncbi:undecaprenyl-diphosphatase [Clostridium pascui]|uniref:phosphatase PAP2 family protein n=1 Tax=Clostridium pascui TaxID=46609 RepID=UPI00195BB5DA|nr:phosphatase PAP2 family protein [Clostridium pascui]MBM7871123.1 undecaprenyl-diphosphatase [Clostridium pascui]